MRCFIILLVIAAIFACMAEAGRPKNDVNRMWNEAKKKGAIVSSCSKGKKKNGKCRRAILRVRSAESEDFIEIPDVEAAHWADDLEEPDNFEDLAEDDVKVEEI